MSEQYYKLNRGYLSSRNAQYNKKDFQNYHIAVESGIRIKSNKQAIEIKRIINDLKYNPKLSFKSPLFESKQKRFKTEQSQPFQRQRNLSSIRQEADQEKDFSICISLPQINHQFLSNGSLSQKSQIRSVHKIQMLQKTIQLSPLRSRVKTEQDHPNYHMLKLKRFHN